MAGNTGKRPRLIIDVTPELRRRIKVAAAERDVSVRDYVVAVLESVVPTGHLTNADYRRVVTEADVDLLRRTREAVMRGRRFADDSTDLINEAREERLAEL